MVGINNISDYSKNLTNLNNVATLQQKLAQLQGEVSTGKKASTFAGYGTDASVTLSFRAQSDRIDSYGAATDRVLARANVMDAAMTNMSSVVTNLVSQMRGVTQSTDPTSSDKTSRTVNTLVQSAKAALTQIVAGLNTRVDDRYVFSGDQVNASPVPDATTMQTNAAAITAGIGTGSTGATVLGNLAGMSSTDLGLNSALATAGNVTVRADDNIDVDYTVKADSSYFKSILQGVSALTQMPFDSAHAAEYWNTFNGIVTSLDTSVRNLDTADGQLGQVRNQLTNLKTQNSDLQSQLQSNISTIEDVDPANALVKLNSMQTQLQASYQVIAQTKDLSLVNFL